MNALCNYLDVIIMTLNVNGASHFVKVSTENQVLQYYWKIVTLLKKLMTSNSNPKRHHLLSRIQLVFADQNHLRSQEY